MKKHEDEEFSFCAYVGTTMQLLDKEFCAGCSNAAPSLQICRNLSGMPKLEKKQVLFGLEYYRTVFCARR